MSAIGPKRTSLVAPHMSAFGGKADMTVCGNPLSRSLSGVKRTCPFALHMSANDPKRTCPLVQLDHERRVGLYSRHGRRSQEAGRTRANCCSKVDGRS